MTARDYPVTLNYGDKTPPYGTAQWPYHRGQDYGCPDGTPIVVNGVQIGTSGHTGFVTGPHVHVGRFVNGADTNPAGGGWQLDNPRVADVGYDDTDGNYVGLLDAQGVRYVYLHMQTKSTFVKPGDVLAQLPQFNEGGDVTTEDEVRKAILGVTGNTMPSEQYEGEVRYWTGRTWAEFSSYLYALGNNYMLAQLKEVEYLKEQLASAQKSADQAIVADLQTVLNKYKAAA